MVCFHELRLKVGLVVTAQAGLRAVNDSLNDSLTSSWSEIQSRFESVEAERHAAVSAAASATSMLADLEQRERKPHDPCRDLELRYPKIWAASVEIWVAFPR